MTITMNDTRDTSETAPPPHIELLVAMATKGVFAVVVTTAGGEPQVHVVRGKRTGGDMSAKHVDRPSRTGFPVAHLAMARAAGLIVETGDNTRYVLSPSGRAAVRRQRASLGAARAAMSAMDAEMSMHAAVSAVMVPGKALVNEAESPLIWLSRRLDRDRRPLIDAVQLAAGDRLRADLYLAHLTPRTTQSWNCIPQSRSERRGPPAAASSMSDGTLAARQRVNAALEAVGSEFADMLIDVCGHLIGLAEIEKRRAWPARSAKLILQSALNQLARHYGMLARHDLMSLAERKLRHWGADDYRPTTDRWKATG